jgi:hypothetical protein
MNENSQLIEIINASVELVNCIEEEYRLVGGDDDAGHNDNDITSALQVNDTPPQRKTPKHGQSLPASKQSQSKDNFTLPMNV